jgi:hypothetical protein
LLPSSPSAFLALRAHLSDHDPIREAASISSTSPCVRTGVVI